MSDPSRPDGPSTPVGRRTMLKGAAAAATAAAATGLVARPGRAAAAEPGSLAGVRTARAAASGAQAARVPVRGIFGISQDWGLKRGTWVLVLETPSITRTSLVFASCSEGPPGGKFVGAARFSIENVAPFDGGVKVRVNIDWPSPLALSVDYLVATI
jgi:hypothetical protein